MNTTAANVGCDRARISELVPYEPSSLVRNVRNHCGFDGAVGFGCWF